MSKKKRYPFQNTMNKVLYNKRDCEYYWKGYCLHFYYFYYEKPYEPYPSKLPDCSHLCSKFKRRGKPI